MRKLSDRGGGSATLKRRELNGKSPHRKKLCINEQAEGEGAARKQGGARK